MLFFMNEDKGNLIWKKQIRIFCSIRLRCFYCFVIVCIVFLYLYLIPYG
ncbi:hypothetical protein C823_008035 [Eubacterium plexicaudatum ASF492]|uniref:Uncharacterized protein n=1 Tax=Eubacterium plexicaudatum ASF492 TaxID=1235802 RepID=N1ZPK8_9FIRM|nr:hypothetical protein C823_008035 [Eubacterium plexicaudatum ASF492]